MVVVDVDALLVGEGFVASLPEAQRECIAGLVATSLLPQTAESGEFGAALLTAAVGSTVGNAVGAAASAAASAVASVGTAAASAVGLGQDGGVAAVTARRLPIRSAAWAAEYLETVVTCHLRLPAARATAILPLAGLPPREAIDAAMEEAARAAAQKRANMSRGVLGMSMGNLFASVTSKDEDSSGGGGSGSGGGGGSDGSDGGATAGGKGGETAAADEEDEQEEGIAWLDPALMHEPADGAPFLAQLTASVAGSARDATQLMTAALRELILLAIADAARTAEAEPETTKESTEQSGRAATLAHAAALGGDGAASGTGKTAHYRGYDARARSALQRTATLAGVRWRPLARCEDRLAETMVAAVLTSTAAAKAGQLVQGADKEGGGKDSSGEGGWGRRLKIGGASVLGGGLLVLTGGLAAPVLAGALASTAAGGGILAGVAGVAASGITLVGGTAGVTVLFGATGAGLAGFKMKRRTQGITEFEFQPLRGTGARRGEEGFGDELPAISDDEEEDEEELDAAAIDTGARGFGVTICVNGLLGKSNYHGAPFGRPGTFEVMFKAGALDCRIRQEMLRGSVWVPVTGGQAEQFKCSEERRAAAVEKEAKTAAATAAKAVKGGGASAVMAARHAAAAATAAEETCGSESWRRSLRVAVLSVMPGGAAAVLGVRRDDVILSVNGAGNVSLVAEVVAATRERPAKWLLQRKLGAAAASRRPSAAADTGGAAAATAAEVKQPPSKEGERDVLEEWEAVNGKSATEAKAVPETKMSSRGAGATGAPMLASNAPWPLRCGEQHVLKWESEALRKVEKTMSKYVQDQATNFAAQQGAKLAVSSVFMAVIWPVTLLQVRAAIYRRCLSPLLQCLPCATPRPCTPLHANSPLPCPL